MPSGRQVVVVVVLAAALIACTDSDSPDELEPESGAFTAILQPWNEFVAENPRTHARPTVPPKPEPMYGPILANRYPTYIDVRHGKLPGDDIERVVAYTRNFTERVTYDALPAFIAADLPANVDFPAEPAYAETSAGCQVFVIPTDPSTQDVPDDIVIHFTMLVNDEGVTGKVGAAAVGTPVPKDCTGYLERPSE